MNSTQPESWPRNLHWDSGPWHGFRARSAAFLASLAVAAGGGWLGYSHGEDLSHQQNAAARPGSAQATDSHEFGVAVDTAGAAIFSFLGTEVVLSLGLVTMQRRYQLNNL